MNTEVIIIGTGGHGQVVADILHQMQKAGDNIRPLGFLDDDLTLHNKIFMDLPVLGEIIDCARLSHDAIIVAIGDNQTRKTIFGKLKDLGERSIIAQHPRTIIAPGTSIGHGSVIAPSVVVNTGSKIGENVILNTSCTIDHHCYIGPHSHIGPGVHIGGNVTIDEGVLVGIGAIIMPGISVNAGATIGAGTLVRSDVPVGSTVVGVPGRLLE